MIRHRRFQKLLLAGLATVALGLAAASTASAYEWNIAKPGSVPDGLPCTSATGAKVCFQHYGDKVWVKDTRSDSMSAIAKWKNIWQGREGYCRNRLGAGRWGVCDKNFLENVWIDWWAARYDRDTDSFSGPWLPGRDARA